jgi:hypothetical protein
MKMSRHYRKKVDIYHCAFTSSVAKPVCMITQKLNISPHTSFAELKLEEFNALKFGVYFIDHSWNYLFVNDYVTNNLGSKGKSLIGKNMWDQFRELAQDPVFMRLKLDTEKGLSVNSTTTSPINGQRLNIVGYPLKDCYFFYASELPKKDELMNELRSAMDRH